MARFVHYALAKDFNRNADTSRGAVLATTSVSLVVPTFNEAENICAMLHRAYAALSRVTTNFEILVVDDSSADGTADIAEAVATRLTNVHVVRREGVRDLSQSVLQGWAAANGEVLAVIDADLQHPPERLCDLLRALFKAEADLAVASRNADGGGVSKWALHRRVISWSATLIAMVLVPGVLRMAQDPMSGFFAVRREVLETGKLDATGYKILLEVLAKTSYESVIEVPYVFEERKKGASKLGRKQITQYLRHVVRLSVSTGEFWLLPRFALVGLSGVIVNAVIAQSASPLSISLGFECSVFSNFLLNEAWTFQGKTSHLAPTQHVGWRLLSFQVVALIGLVVNLVTFAALKGASGGSDVLCAAIAITLGGICNLLASTHLTWSLWSEETVVTGAGALTRHRRRPVSALHVAGKQHLLQP